MSTKPDGIVIIHGREYETVAKRVQKFRDKHPAFTLKTEVKTLDQEQVLIEAQILDESGRLIANGHAQEFRQSSTINKTSYVENCETSAIGRALAAFGLGGTEFATADELVNAIQNKREPDQRNPLTALKEDAFASLPDDEQKFLLDIKAKIEEVLTDKTRPDHEREDIAFGFVENQRLEIEEKLGLWSQLDSKTRSAIKRGQARADLTKRAAERSKHQESRPAARTPQ